MALNEEKLLSLQGKIEGLEVQKGMKNAVTQIKQDLFDLFVDEKVRASDERSITSLDAGLSKRIKSYTEQIENKADTDIVGDLTVSSIKQNIQALEKQVSVLQEIKHIITQIKQPASIQNSVLATNTVDASVLSSAIVQDFAEFNVKLTKNAKVRKADKDIHPLLVDNVSEGRYLLKHEGALVATVVSDKKSWNIHVEESAVKQLGITSFDLPLVMSKDMKLPSFTKDKVENTGKTSVEKQKTWKVVLDNWDYAAISHPIENTSTVVAGTESQSMQDLIATNKKLVDLLGNTHSASTAVSSTNTTIDTQALQDSIEKSKKKLSNKIQKTHKLIEEVQKDLVNKIGKSQASLDKIQESLKELAELDAKVSEMDKNLSKKLDDISASIEGLDDSLTEKTAKLLKESFEQQTTALEKLLDTKLSATVESCKDLIQKTSTKNKEEHDEILKQIKELSDKLNNPPVVAPVIPPTTPSVVAPVDPSLDPDEPIARSPASIDISAHVMDKESLVQKSVEQDVLEEYQHKYAKRRWPRRLAMSMYGRIMQNSRINKRMRSARAFGDAIETDAKRQQRVSSSIANFAYEADMGLVDDTKVRKTELDDNDEVNTIANSYIKGEIDRNQAVENFNNFFANNSEYSTGMTGTDIMEQLDDIAFMVALEDAIKPRDHRKMQTVISQFMSTHPNAIFHTVKIPQSGILSTAELDKVADAVGAYKVKTAVTKLNEITANVKLYKIEKDTNDLTESKLDTQSGNWADWMLGGLNAATFGLAGSTLGRAGLKIAAGAGLTAGGLGTLPVVGGVAAMAAVLQGMKTYRDYLTEAKKTHEDAMMMGTAELDKRIKELEGQIKKHGMLQKTMAFWGFGKHAIRTKQLNILHAVNDKMHATGAMQPASVLIQNMKQINKNTQATAIVDTLARVQVGRELDANFISGSSRALTEQERKTLLIQLRESSADWARKSGYAHAIPDVHDDVAVWKSFRANVVLGDPNIKSQYDKKCEMLKKAFADMKSDINKGRRNMALRDTATNIATSVTVAGVAAGASALLGSQGWVPGKSSYSGDGPHNEYALGKYDQTLSPGSVTDKASGRDAAFNNGDKVSFTGEASVDAVHATTKTFGNIAKEVADTELLAKAFDTTTQTAVHNALTTELAKLKAEAIASGADAGNVALVQQRWIDGVEEILTKFTATGKTGVTIEEIKFDPSAFWSIDIQKSVASGGTNIVDRAVAFDASVNGVRGHYDMGDPIWAVWPGFSNTYAKPGTKANDQSDSWSKDHTESEKRVAPWSEKGKQKKEREKYIKEHEKLVATSKEYKEAADRYEKLKKHQEEMTKLQEKNKTKLAEIEASMQSIHGNQTRMRELEQEKRRLELEIKNAQANIDKNAKDLYNRQRELEKFIGRKGGEKKNTASDDFSKHDVDRVKESPKNMTDAEVAKRWQYDEEFDKKLTPSHTEKTLAGNIKAVQSLSDAEWQQLNRNAKLIHDRYTEQTAKLKLDSSVRGKDEAWTRWHLAKELSYARGTNTQSNSTKYPVFDPTQTISDVDQQRIVDTHVGWEAQTASQVGNRPRYVSANNSIDVADRPRFNELLAKKTTDTHSREFAELGRLMTAKLV